jgi:hypothetical protein
VHATPARLDDVFLEIGDRVDSPTAPPPKFAPEEIGERQTKLGAILAKHHRTEMATA